MIKYTIVIPHKNCPNLLARCLQSIPQREDIEIIIVDDNSDENIVDFEHFPGYTREGVNRVFSKKSGGAGFARNKGLELAKGKWILFADADDFYEPNAFNIIDDLVSEDIDMLYFTSIFRNSETLQVSDERRVYSNEMVVNYIDKDLESDLKIRYHNSAPWNKVIRRDIITKNNIKFDEIKMNNDVFFAIKLGDVIENYKVVKQDLYCFTFRENSISTQKRLFKDENLLLVNRIRTNQFYNKINSKILHRRYLGIFYTVYKRNGLLYFIKYVGFVILNLNYLFLIKKKWDKPEYI
jgi:glycosyltransferase involved in cell wall biosynthesis